MEHSPYNHSRCQLSAATDLDWWFVSSKTVSKTNLLITPFTAKERCCISRPWDLLGMPLWSAQLCASGSVPSCQLCCSLGARQWAAAAARPTGSREIVFSSLPNLTENRFISWSYSLVAELKSHFQVCLSDGLVVWCKEPLPETKKRPNTLSKAGWTNAYWHLILNFKHHHHTSEWSTWSKPYDKHSTVDSLKTNGNIKSTLMSHPIYV